jgi:hypothetical protein
MSATADELFARFPPRARALAPDVRRFVLDSVPTFTERVYGGWGALGFSDAQAGFVCALWPMEDGVCLSFEHGAELDDPDGLFAPPGKKKQVRYVEIRSARDIRKRALEALLRRAIVKQSV